MKQAKLFINMSEESIPWSKNDPRYSDFWNEEKRKVKEGVIIDGFQFSGWLYWHINHWPIKVDEDTPDAINAEIMEVKPTLRDNELVINSSLLEAERDRKGLTIMGLRQFGKTSFEASYSGRAGILFKGSQNLIMGTSVDDLNNITASIDFGLLNCTPYFRVPRITKDWTKERVLLGMKRKNNDNVVHSTYVIRNTAGGVKTEKGAGVSNLKSNLWDEIGKDDFLRALTATKPAMLGANGWRSIPILTGTGGNIVKAKDAKELFFNPDTHTMLSFIQPDGRKTGLFMSGEYRTDCKYKMNLGDYLISEGILKDIPEDSELFKTKVLISNKEEARAKIDAELKSYLDAGDISNYNAWKSYYPLEIDDMFLSESNNQFPIDACRRQQKNLLANYDPQCVDFYRDESNSVRWKESHLIPISKFPIAPKDVKDAPVIIYEHPELNVPFGTYCIGIDPYNEDSSSSKVNSLGCIYVYKRMYNPMGEMQNSMVASWAGRKDEVKQFHQLCLDICEYYNAIGSVNPENEDKTLLQFFFYKNKGHLFAPSQELSKEISPNTAVKRPVGLAATTKNQQYGMNLIVADAKDEVTRVSEDGEENTYMGVYKIPDPMLLEEMMQYRSKTAGKGIHDGNFDRIVAWYHAIILARYFDIIYPIGRYKSPEELADLEKRRREPKNILHTPFGDFKTQTHNNIFIKDKITPTHRRGFNMFPR